MTILEFDSIEKSFGGRSILKSIYLKSTAGIVTGLLGRNGSGKSTLMKIVFGSMASTFKSIRINKTPITGNYIKQKLIAYLPQSNWLPPRLKVKQVLKHFDIPETRLTEDFPVFVRWIDFPIQKLSGGYRRILEVYLILHSMHQFVLLDEPFSGLMPLHIEELKRVINQVKASKGIIISDHLYKYVLDIADENYLLSNGQTYPIKNKEDLIMKGYLNEE